MTVPPRPPPVQQRTPIEQALITLTEGVCELNETVRKLTLVVERDMASRQLGAPREKMASVEDLRKATDSDATELRLKHILQKQTGKILWWAIGALASGGGIVHLLHLAGVLHR